MPPHATDAAGLVARLDREGVRRAWVLSEGYLAAAEVWEGASVLVAQLETPPEATLAAASRVRESDGLTILNRLTGQWVFGENGTFRSPIWAGDTLFVAGALDRTNQALTARDALGNIHWSATPTAPPATPVPTPSATNH